MPITINREQRDAVRDAILTNLSGVGDIHIVLMNRDWAQARRLRAEYEGEMRLLDDLGWGDDEQSDTFEITMEPVALRHLVARLHDLASTELATYVSQPLNDQAVALRRATACVAFGAILAALPGDQASP